MLKIERQNLIDQDLRKAGYVLVPELSEKLRCSEETVRRDLREMEIAGKLVRTHGGAYLVEKYDKGYPIELRKSYLQHTKERMAAAAVSIIQENDMVMLDSSTTCLTIAEAILALYSVAVWSPRLNEKGNSVMGMKALELLTTETEESIF